MKKLDYDRITTTIEREWLAEIIAGTKRSSTATSSRAGQGAIRTARTKP